MPTALDPAKILVVLPTWVGDLVMATPALAAIRRRYPTSHITFLGPTNLADVLSGGPWMNEVVLWDKRSETIWSLTARIRRGRHDWALLLSNSFRSALLTLLAGIPRRIGYSRDARGWMLTDRLSVPRKDGAFLPHPMVDYYGALAQAVDCSPPGDRLELYTTADANEIVADRLRRLGLSGHPRLVVFAPGASFGASKCWLPERFAQLGDRLVDECGAAVLITCGPGEERIAQAIGRQMTRGGVVMDSPRCSLSELKSLIGRCQLLVCNDIGPRHFAKAFNVPVVTIFGPTDPQWTDTTYALERKVRIDVDCGPCQKKICPLGHHKCMTGVTVDMVLAACRNVLEQRAGLK